MTESTYTEGDLGADASASPWPRTVHRSPLRPATSRRELHATARQEARLVRGRQAFVWSGRVLPIGIPLAAGAGTFVWHRRRSGRNVLAVAVAVGVLSYLEARVEWTVRRSSYRRHRNRD